ncbi:MAG: glycosyl hydrolase, partial [Armatimonadota bacterium]
DTQKLIACVEATEGGGNSIRDDRMRGGGVFRSDDGGTTWRRCSYRSPRAFYFSKIKFDPADDNRVYMLGWTTEVSDDGGETFRGGVADLLHADHHAILVSPTDSSHLLVGTDGGLYQSFDKGETWDFLNTMATGQFYNIALDDSEPYRVMGGLQDNGSWIGWSATNKLQPKDDAQKVWATSLTNADWQDVFWGDGFHVAFDPTDTDTVYAEWQGGHVTRLGLKDGSNKYCRPEAREGERKLRFNWNTPFFVSAHDPTVLYMAGNIVYKLTERGDKWAAISPDLTTDDAIKSTTDGSVAEQYCTVVALSESTLEQGVLAAGSDDGLVHVTRNDGGSWKAVTPSLVGGRYISRLQWSSAVKGRLYMTVDGHRGDDMQPYVLVSEDYGASWKNITADLPKGRSAKVIREDRFNPSVLYVGTEGGMFMSIDRGGSWLKMHGKALPTVPVDDIQQHGRETDVVI